MIIPFPQTIFFLSLHFDEGIGFNSNKQEALWDINIFLHSSALFYELKPEVPFIWVFTTAW